MLGRICAANLTAPLADAGAVDDEWVQVRLRFPAVAAARTLLSFGDNVEVVSPPEVRADLASVAADVVAATVRSRRAESFDRLCGRV